MGSGGQGTFWSALGRALRSDPASVAPLFLEAPMNGNDDILRLRARLDRIETHLGLRPHAFRGKPPFYGLTPASGLHFLKDGWQQVESMREQCLWLQKELDLALEATRVMAPARNAQQGFQLAERLAQHRPANGEERQLEWDLYDLWQLTRNAPPESPFWDRLVGFQVPLYDHADRDWLGQNRLGGNSSSGCSGCARRNRIEEEYSPGQTPTALVRGSCICHRIESELASVLQRTSSVAQKSR